MQFDKIKNGCYNNANYFAWSKIIMLKSKKVTLKEIASAVNLAVPTVSQILNGRKNFCSQEQCEKVRQTAREMGYVPNIGYKILTGQITHTIGIMVACAEHMQEEHYRTLVLNLLKIFATKGCSSFCHILSTDKKNAYKEVEDYIGRGVERFVFLGQPFGSEEIFATLKKLQIPYIGSNMAFERFVMSDTAIGRQEIFRFLDQKTAGKFKIFWWKDSFHLLKRIIEPMENSKYYLAKHAYIDNCIGNYYDSAFTIGYNSMQEVLDNNPEIKGLAYPNDAIALGAARCLIERNIKDFYLTGCNGERELLRYPYPVSTAIFDLDKVSSLLAERVFDNGECKIYVPVTLKLV